MDERLRELNEELSELNGRLARANGLERRLDDLRAQYEERKARVEETARLLTKEREDVEKLERGGLRALLLSLTGDREARLSQERREELAARLQYDQARRDAEDLEERIRDLLQEREELRAVRTRLEALLGEKAERLKELGGTGGTRLAELDRALDALAAQRREVGEALHAGRQAEQALSGVLDSLDSAESWGTWDMLGGGLFTTMAKHGHASTTPNGPCPASAPSWPTCGTWSFPRYRSGSSPPLPTTSSTVFSWTGWYSPKSRTPRKACPRFMSGCSTRCGIWSGWIRSWRRSRTA